MIEMPKLALTHFPAQQHQDGDYAENAQPSLYRVGIASSVRVSPLSDIPHKRKREDSPGHEDREQRKSALVTIPDPNE